MNRQEIFDRVARHLLKQGRPAVTIGTRECRYRTDDGLKCAVGCLIADEHYNSVLEGKSPADQGVIDALRKSGVNVRTDVVYDPPFLIDLQIVHDNLSRPDEVGFFAANIRARLETFAELRSLSTAVLKEEIK